MGVLVKVTVQSKVIVSPGSTSTGVQIYNNTVVRKANGDHGIQCTVDGGLTLTVDLKNNIVTGWPNGDFDMGGAGTLNDTHANDLSSDDTADDYGGSDNLVNKTAANQFENASYDWNLKAGADALDAGITIAGFDWDAVHDDADNWRPQGDEWDIGALEAGWYGANWAHRLAITSQNAKVA